MGLLTSYSGALGRRGAAHLLRRTTFGTTRQQIDSLSRKKPQEAVAWLMNSKPALPQPIDLKTEKTWLPARRDHNSREGILRSYVVTTWLDHMSRSNASLAERMVFFYHTHFTTMQSRANYGSALYYQNKLFRHYALGNIKKLATKLCFDTAMLRHLDGHLNKNRSPNENFAREFLELYTIGKGPQGTSGDYTYYTEHDVKQATRVLSGFYVDTTFSENIDPETGIPIMRMPQRSNGEPTLHDFGSKTFSEKFGGTTITPTGRTQEAVRREIEDFVEMVFAQPETARHLCRKLYRFFVYHQITDAVEQDVIAPLAETLQRQNYEVKPVLQALLSSQHFYDVYLPDKKRKVSGALIKSPLEFVLGTLRYFDVKLPSASQREVHYELYGRLRWTMDKQGLLLYEPVEVAGYPAYHQAPGYDQNWITASTLAYRRRFIKELLYGLHTQDKRQAIKLDVMSYVNKHVADPGDPERTVRELLEDVFPQPVSEDRFHYFLHEVLLDNLPPESWLMEWNEYRKKKSSSIQQQFEKLFSAVLYAPEYQLN